MLTDGDWIARRVAWLSALRVAWWEVHSGGAEWSPYLAGCTCKRFVKKTAAIRGFKCPLLGGELFVYCLPQPFTPFTWLERPFHKALRELMSPSMGLYDPVPGQL